MHLKPEQLQKHLEKNGLRPLYYVSGDEPLQLLESLDLIRNYARQQGIDERILFIQEKGAEFDWNNLYHANADKSLFSDRQLIELRLRSASPGREGGAALVNYTETCAPENILLLSSPKIDKRSQQSKWFKALDRIGCIIQVWDIAAAQLPGWIVQRCSQQQKTMQRDAANLIAQRVEGNLLAAKQEIDKLCLLIDAPRITLQDALNTVTDSSRFDVFKLIETACMGNLEKARRMLLGLKNEGVEPIAIYGALMWEVRRIKRFCHEAQQSGASGALFKKHGIWQQRQAVYKKLAQRLDATESARILLDAGQLDRAIKGALPVDRWQVMEKFIFRLGGVRLAA
ncbi:MAG: DNA polymerase III subunit delta [Gammaproteobacteria bacterium]